MKTHLERVGQIKRFLVIANARVIFPKLAVADRHRTLSPRVFKQPLYRGETGTPNIDAYGGDVKTPQENTKFPLRSMDRLFEPCQQGNPKLASDASKPLFVSVPGDNDIPKLHHSTWRVDFIEDLEKYGQDPVATHVCEICDTQEERESGERKRSEKSLRLHE